MLLAALTNRTDLISADTSTFAIVLLLVAVAVAWWALHRWKSVLFPGFWLGIAGVAARVLVGMLVLWVFSQVLARTLVLATNWSLWTHGFIGGLAVELIFMLYGWERTLISKRLGKWLLGLRLGALTALLFMLWQPVFARERLSEQHREVVVLVDDSASMHISDQQMTVPEKMELAQFAGIAGLSERPPLNVAYGRLEELSRNCQSLATDLDIPDDYGPEVAQAALTKLKDRIKQVLADVKTGGTKFKDVLQETRSSLPEEAKEQIRTDRRTLESTFPESLKDWQEALDKTGGNQAFTVRSAVRRVQAILEQLVAKGRRLTALSDTAFYDEVPKETRDKLDAQAARTRSEIAREALERPRTDGKSIVEQLKTKYGGVRLIRFGQKAEETPSLDLPKFEPNDPFRLRSDLTGALKHIDEQFDENSLAGVLLVSDARHNGDVPVDDPTRNLGRKGAPVCTVLVGSQRGVKDAAIITVAAPQAIFEGDKLRTRVEMKADGLRGEKISVRLLENGTEVAKEEVLVSDDSFRNSVRLQHQPKAAGIYNYTVKIDPVKGELFPNNNEWSFQTAVSDDRTNVLLVDQRPRWEFRYLRNLFDSRDKSVQLQYVLMEPDELPGAPKLSKVASVASKFGDSEASEMPKTLEEWMKFDVIILGDLIPGAMGAEVWNMVKQCVENRGTTLVMIAGPNAMPHAYTNEVFKELCPVKFSPDTAPRLAGPEDAYKLELTSTGRSHVVFQQSASALENADIWAKMPVLHWRNPITGVKDNAEVLAYARPVELDAAGNEPALSALSASADPAALTRQREEEKRNALAVTSPYGVGKVFFLTFDQTWRLRYGKGDVHHHRLWGQLLRWGAGENLRAGNDLARLGTDQLTYAPGTQIQVLAKLVEADFRPVTDAKIYANVTLAGQRVSRARLEYREQSNGMYEAIVESTLAPGEYEIALDGDAAARLAPQGVKTKFTVRAETNPIEYGELSVDPETASKMASLSGGKVFTPTTAEQALSLFGTPSKEKMERLETRFWDHWALLAAAVVMLTAEWILRRRGGLA